ncbi:hypothetical protein Salat_1073400 [Sesamum alatum]|uniref:Uncharacterized protein n=1 Tax=Sesamum alatum TaxID=300844 RepID=A0AAE2CSQ1_9LAMI|nr:hypothetical protein Salat_1073400 [Sesamum alatum]
MALNIKMKGKKVFFANEHQIEVNDNLPNTSTGVVNIGHAGHTEATTGNLNNSTSAMHDGNDGSNYIGHVKIVNVADIHDGIHVVVHNTFDNVAGHDSIGDVDKTVVKHELSTNMIINCESVDMPTLNNAFEGDDDFDYEDPILAALIGKKWDEEITARKNTTDIIVDVEAINDMLEMIAYKTPERVKALTVSKSANIRNTSSPATVGSIQETTSKSHTDFSVPIQNIEKDSSSNHARPKEDLEEDEPTPTFNRFQSLENLNDNEPYNETEHNNASPNETRTSPLIKNPK